MENENILQQFEAIEQRIDTLVSAKKALEQTNSEMKAKIERLEAELQAKIDAEQEHDHVRTQIRSKIDSLLVRLEDIADV